MNKQVKAALGAVRDLISGQSTEPTIADVVDKATRKAVAAELLAAMSRGVARDARKDDDQAPEQLAQEQKRSRQLFMELGYFDEAVQDLRAGNSAAERAAAARALGLVGSQRATVDLVAAMFDDDEEVRNAAGEALAQVENLTVITTPATEIFLIEPAEMGASEPADSGATDFNSFGNAPTAEDAPSEIRSVPASLDSVPAFPSSELRQLPVEEVTEPSIEIDKPVAMEEQLLLEEHSARETIDKYERQLVTSAALRQKAENEARWRNEREARIALEAEARRVEEEQQRQRVEADATRRRANEAESFATESSARQQAEAEVHRLIEEEARLRVETANLRRTAEELSRQRWQLETARREEAEAAQLAAATRARQEAEKSHQREVERLQNEEQALRFALEETILRRSEVEASRDNAEAEIAALRDERNRLVAAAEIEIEQFKEEIEQLLSAEASRRAEAERLRLEAEERKRSEEELLRNQMDSLTKSTNEVSARRAEVEAARVRAEQDSERLAESLARMRAAEEKRFLAEQERLQVETTSNERVANEERLLDEARRRAVAEQARLEEEKRRHDEAEDHRMAALEELHRQAEVEAKQRADREKQLLSEIDHVRIEDAEVRRRIEEAETVKRTSEQAYRVAAEKLQRTEAEAHAATLQEKQTLTKLEAVRRDLTVQAQARAAQEKRIRQEIDQLERLQDEERPRVEAAILQRTAAAARLQQMKETRTEVPPAAPQRFQVSGSSLNRTNTSGGPAETPKTGMGQAASKDEGLRLVSAMTSEEVDYDLSTGDTPTLSAEPAVGLYLKSVDPYKRAAAVAELARSNGAGAFDEIVKCFDDHSPQVRNAAARALSQLEPSRTVDFFNRALEEGTEERRLSIGSAVAGSGMASESIDSLASDSRENTYNALSILFVMAKAGEVQPLVRAIEEHQNDEVRSAVVKLLTLSGHGDLAEGAMKKREGS